MSNFALIRGGNNEMTGGTRSMLQGRSDAHSYDQNVPARDRREVGHAARKPLAHHHLLDLHVSLGLRVGGWIAVEPAANRICARPEPSPPGIPALFQLHLRRVADGCGRRDHRAPVPAAQGMGVRGLVFPLLGAIASHMSAGDGVLTWLMPAVFSTFVIASWALRPADRRFPNAVLAPENRPLAWAVPIGILVLLIV